MSLDMQFHMSRIPIKPLPYRNRDLAQNSEFMIDYVGENGSTPSYHLFIVDANDSTKIIDLTNIMIREAFGNDITINIEGLEEPLSLHDLLNFIYKRFLYPENLLGFDFNRDLDKLLSPNTRNILMQNTDGIYFLPVTTADNVFDKSGVNIQDRLDNITRLGFANDYIKVAQDNQNVFEITYPFLNYTENGNYIELRIGTVFVDKTRYSLIDNYDEYGNVIGGTITFFNETFEKDRRIDILYMYNAIGAIDGDKAAIYGNQIANGSININKFEKFTNSYIINDGACIATSAALYSLYKDFSDALNANSGYAYFLLDNSSIDSEIYINLTNYNVGLTNKYLFLNVLTTVKKVETITLTIDHGTQDKHTISQFLLNVPGGVPANRLIKILVNSNVAKALTLTEEMLTTTRYIYTCIDAETDISFSQLSYEVGSVIRVYRNGVRLFEDLDYHMDKPNEKITLYNRTEEGERIVFEAMTC